MEGIHYDKQSGKWIVSSYEYCKSILQSSSFRTPNMEEIDEDTPSFFLALTIANEDDFDRLKYNFASYFTKSKVEEMKEQIFIKNSNEILNKQNNYEIYEDTEILKNIIVPYCTNSIIQVIGADLILGKELVTAYKIGNRYYTDNKKSEAQVYYQYVIQTLSNLLKDDNPKKSENNQSYLYFLQKNNEITESEKVSMLVPFIDMLASSKTMELPLLSFKNYIKYRKYNLSLSYIVEESARLLDNVFLSRFALTNFEIGGNVIKAGEKVHIRISEASKDENIYKCPNSFQFMRENLNEIISFGSGTHRCLGKHFTFVLIKTLLEEVDKVDKVSFYL
ncbi:cytochrome P450 [Bacillus cereus]|uniref:cytochrome P450 n=1 Tax=Bacillus cereus TaxID=1396 RepID=UPI0018797E25|nr:cytochrome P450 [Bacillus cereus]MBE7099153.1 cytochrome P450 [Bacillus cereus]